MSRMRPTLCVSILALLALLALGCSSSSSGGKGKEDDSEGYACGGGSSPTGCDFGCGNDNDTVSWSYSCAQNSSGQFACTCTEGANQGFSFEVPNGCDLEHFKAENECK
jgi:hypothetical protein